MIALALAVAGCSISDEPSTPPSPTPSAPPSPTTSEPFTWPQPDPDRPVVDLSFEVAEDLSGATGTQRISFTPGRSVCDVVFRAWPNKPATAATGNSMTVQSARIDGAPVRVTTEQAGAPAGSPGTLVRLPLQACAAAGQTLDIEMEFTLTLGEGTDERVGRSADREVAWFGTAYPLLAWDDTGWALDDAVRVVGESTTSTAFELASLTVTAPSRFEVSGIGSADGAVDRGDGTTDHVFTAPVLRDVTFTVGELQLSQVTTDAVTVIASVPRFGAASSARAWAEEVAEAATALADEFGPVPYETLWISVLPGVTDGVEYSGAVQFEDADPRDSRWLILHEVAHQWFYGLVGNNQARHPWLDEAFATYAVHLVDGRARARDDQDLRGIPGAVGESMAFFADQRRSSRAYVRTVYEDGGRALAEARSAAGPERFDEAVRRYLVENAHGVATPGDLERALQDLPEALDVLREYGALADDG